MDINTLRSAVTAVSLLVFLGIVAWAWSRGRAPAFDEAARLPFIDDDPGDRSSSGGPERAAPSQTGVPRR